MCGGTREEMRPKMEAHTGKAMRIRRSKDTRICQGTVDPDPDTRITLPDPSFLEAP